MFRYLPEQASDIAPRVDWIHNWITDLSVFFTVLIVGTALYYTFRYRRRGGVDHETPRIEGNSFLEVIWTVVPTLVCIWLAYYGSVIFVEMRKPSDPDANPVEVYVKGRKWQWDFEYENGKKTTHEFVLPVNRQARLIMRSSDVLHSFFIPAMRVKHDVIPGRYSYITFKPIRTGEYNSFCTEYCGDLHWSMLAKLRVVPQAEYERWLADRADEEALAGLAPKDRGLAVYQQQNCVQCHSVDGSPGIAPTLFKLYGSERVFTDGTRATADEEYLSESILEPHKKLVSGYGAVMPAVYADALSDEDVQGLVAFIKSLDGSEPAPIEPEVEEEDEDLSKLTPAERGRRLYEAKACIGCHSLDGVRLVGPTFKGLYGKKGKLEGGGEYVADDEYIKRSILKPMEQIVEGYAPGMLSYEGQLSDEEINDIIAFIKTLNDEPGQPEE